MNIFHYKDVDDWLHENEGFSLRIERVPPEAVPWAKTAWQLGDASAARYIRIVEMPVLMAITAFLTWGFTRAFGC